VLVPEIVLGFLVATAFWLLIAIIYLPDALLHVLKDWQTLIASIVALIAAYIAFHNTTRSIRNAEDLERPGMMSASRILLARTWI
jgi:hypothetical protein